MTTRTLRFGFTVGSAVALAAAQGALSDSASEDNWGQPPSATSVTISVDRRTNRVAPEPMWFTASTDGFTLPAPPPESEIWDAEFHGLLFKWTFPNEGGFDAPWGLLPEWAGAPNVRYGQKVPYVARTPGSHTILLEVWDRDGNYASQTMTLSGGNAVLDRNAVWTGSNVVLCDPTGAGDPAYPGANVQTTWDNAWNAYRNLPGSGMLLVRRGSTLSTTSRIFSDANFVNVYVSTFGTGARPTLNTNTGLWFWQINDTAPASNVWDGVNAVGGWNPVTLEGTDGLLNGFFFTQGPQDTLILDTLITNYPFGLRGSDVAGRGVLCWNTKITGYADYSALLGCTNDTVNQRSRTAFVGCDLAQNPLATSGGPKFTSPMYPAHTWRFSGHDLIYASCTSWGSFNGWFPVGGFLEIQSIRFTETTALTYIYLDRCAFEGIVTFVPTDGSPVNSPVNAVVDKAVFLYGSSVISGGSAIGRGGVTLRNFFALRLNIKHFQRTPDSYGYDEMLLVVGTGNPKNGQTTDLEPIQIYNGTLVNLLEPAFDPVVTPFIRESAQYPNLRIANVVEYAPNRSPVIAPQGTLAAGANIADGRFLGYAYAPGWSRATLAAPIDASQTTGILLVGSESGGTSIQIARLGSPLTLSIDGEQITYTGVTNVGGGNRELLGVTRGANGTTAAAHTNAAGNVWGGAVPRQTAYATPPGVFRLYAPVPGAPALGGVTGDLWAIDDIRGVIRPTVKDQGAVQVST